MLKPWSLPLIVAAIVVPLLAGVALGGPALGVLVAFGAALAIAVIAIRRSPKGPIETATTHDSRRHVLVVLAHELDSDRAVERIKDRAGIGELESDAEVLVLAPARSSLLDRWATDVAEARQEAQRKLVVSIASLGKAHVDARATVGDEDIVRAVEDALRTFPATEVFLAVGSADDETVEKAHAELRKRLEQDLHRLDVSA